LQTPSGCPDDALGLVKCLSAVTVHN
jgi:hypothetical protein